MATKNLIDPTKDGLDHINIYSKGKTLLGRLLSNFAQTPFICLDGKFSSIEGYWYWLGLEESPRREELRLSAGWFAKKLGRELRGEDWNSDPNFENKIIADLQSKLEQNPQIQDLLKDSILPFKHYYAYDNKVVDESVRGKFLLDFWENARSELKGIPIPKDNPLF